MYLILATIIIITIITLYYVNAKVLLYPKPNYGGFPRPVFGHVVVAEGTPRSYVYRSFVAHSPVVFTNGLTSTLLVGKCGDLAELSTHHPQVAENTTWGEGVGAWSFHLPSDVELIKVAQSNLSDCLDRKMGKMVDGELKRTECKDFQPVVDEQGQTVFVVAKYESNDPVDCQGAKPLCSTYDQLSRVSDVQVEPFRDGQEVDRVGMANVLGNRRTLNFAVEK